MPEYYTKKLERNTFFNDYIKTYIERDVRDLTQVGNIVSFEKFLVSVASRNGELLNYNAIAMDAGINEKKVHEWLSILVASDIIYLLQPYMSSELKIVTKTPKIVFMDTGLCSYLCKWSSAENLMNSSTSGHYLESFIISEIIKNMKKSDQLLDYDIYFYRDRDGKEIDLLINFDNTLFPFEKKRLPLLIKK